MTPAEEFNIMRNRPRRHAYRKGTFYVVASALQTPVIIHALDHVLLISQLLVFQWLGAG
jgi:hypothetical protein